MNPPLSERAARRVLQSLIGATARALAPKRALPPGSWLDTLPLGERGCECLGCDSLDRLQVATAVNEMFHVHAAGLEAELLQAATFGDVVRVVQQAWAAGVDQVSVRTSGSTGMPKFCVHSWANLALEIDCLEAAFRSRNRVVAFTPAHHLYGLLFTAMLPDRLALPVCDLQGGPADAPPSRLQRSDLVVSFPDGWAWIEANIRTTPPDVEGVTSTALCPRTLINSLTGERFSGFTEVYGASETAGVGMRRWPETTYTLMPQWTRAADEQQPQLRHAAGFCVEPMDTLAFFDSTHFEVSRRNDHAVQVAGTNVFPAVLAKRLETFPGVAGAAVRLMHPSEGSRLKCFVVPAPECNEAELEDALSRWFETWDSAAERPKAIRFGKSLPRDSMGKLTDW